MPDINPSGQTSPLGKARLLSDSVTTPYLYQGSIEFPITLSKSGGMGFQYEGGVITVEATSPEVIVSFDRPMFYDGAHTHNPTGKPYDIGTPSLAINARSLNIPITVGPSFLELLSTVAPFSDSVVLLWEAPAVLLSSESWIISTSTGAPVRILSIRAGTAQTFITTTAQTTGATYSLYIPASSIFSYPNGSANDSLTTGFIGGGTQVFTQIDGSGPSYSNPPPYEPTP